MKRFALAAGILALAGPLFAQGFTIDYAVRNSLSGGDVSESNSNAFDATNNLIVTPAYRNAAPSGMTMYHFNASDGSAATPAFVNITGDASQTQGALSPFAVTALDGMHYIYNDSGFAGPGGIEVLDNPTDTQSTLLTTWAAVPFSRNMDIIGEGENTHIAVVGTGAAGDSAVRLVKSDNAGRTSFTLVGQVGGSGGDTGTGRAGVGMAGAPTTGFGPEWIAAGDTIGITGGRLTVHKRIGPLTDPNLGYQEIARLTRVTADVVIDLGGSGRVPVVMALHSPADDVNNSADIVMYQIVESPTPALTEIASISLPKSDTGINLGTTSLTDRGSLDIDRTNMKIYAMYRPGSPATDVVIARLTYDNSDPTTTSDWDLYD